jgi:hypothetical protein
MIHSPNLEVNETRKEAHDKIVNNFASHKTAKIQERKEYVRKIQSYVFIVSHHLQKRVLIFLLTSPLHPLYLIKKSDVPPWIVSD